MSQRRLERRRAVGAFGRRDRFLDWLACSPWQVVIIPLFSAVVVGSLAYLVCGLIWGFGINQGPGV